MADMQPSRPARPGQPTDPRAAAQQAQLAASLAGAVDLAAVKARSDAAARAAAAPPPSAAAPAGAPGAAVVDVDEATFQTEVIDRSFQVPVVLDLWAEWCGPCKQLSPVLEKLAAEGGGSWVLAKVDVDANPNLSQGLRVQGIPAVKAVWQGQLVAEFTGAIPEEQARQFVTELVAATTGGAVPGGEATEPEEPEDPRLDAAEAALDAGDLAGAEAAYQQILDVEPDHPVASVAIKQVALFRRAEEAGPVRWPRRRRPRRRRRADPRRGLPARHRRRRRRLRPPAGRRPAHRGRGPRRSEGAPGRAVRRGGQRRPAGRRRPPSAVGRPLLRAAGQASSPQEVRPYRKPCRKTSTSWNPDRLTSGNTVGSLP